MPFKTLKSCLTFALAFTVIHLLVVLAVFIFRFTPGLGSLSDTVVLGTIYLPLVPWQLAEAPILEPTKAMFDPPNALGWIIVVLSWASLYVLVGYLLSVLVRKFK